jgi:hypothetical protein
LPLVAPYNKGTPVPSSASWISREAVLVVPSGGNVLLKGRGGLAQCGNLFRGGGDQMGRRRPRFSDNTLRRVGHCSSSRGGYCFCGLG